MNIAPAIEADTVSVPPRPARRWLMRIVLLVLAVPEALDGLYNTWSLFDPFYGPRYVGLLVKAHIATHPVLALAALLFAAMGKVRGAIAALGAIVVIRSLKDMPSVILNGLDFAGLSDLLTAANVILFPLLAACAIACALRNQRLGLATLLVSVPILFNLLFVILSALSDADSGC